MGAGAARVQSTTRATVPRESWAADAVAGNLPPSIKSQGDIYDFVERTPDAARAVLGLDQAALDTLKGSLSVAWTESMTTAATGRALGAVTSAATPAAVSTTPAAPATAEVGREVGTIELGAAMNEAIGHTVVNLREVVNLHVTTLRNRSPR